jgi:hypothetical protein
MKRQKSQGKAEVLPVIELTKEQLCSLAGPQEDPPQVHDPESDTTYVLIKKDTFERMKSVLGEDDSEQWAAFLEAAGDEWDDPAMDVYEQYRKKK